MFSLVATSIIALNIFATPYIAQTDPVNAIRIYESASDRLSEIKAQREEHVESTVQTRRERIISRSEMLSERKQVIVSNLVDRFTNVKTKWVDHWGNVLTRLEAILAKIETRAFEEEIAIDVSEAETAITAAQAAIDELSATEYLFEIDDEQSLGQNVREAIAVFKEDMTNTREAVFEAKSAVQAVFADLRSQHEE